MSKDIKKNAKAIDIFLKKYFKNKYFWPCTANEIRNSGPEVKKLDPQLF